MFRDIHRHHRFFCNKEMNEIYLSVFLMNLAESMISIFVPIYLYTLDYSIVQILVFFLIGHLGNVLFALPVAKVVSKIGAKHAILLSTLFIVIYYLGLRGLPEYSVLFFILPFGITFRSLLYNFGFDLNFIDHLNIKRVGRELSLLSNLVIIATVAAPLAAGLIITFFGYGIIFLVGSVILVIAALPLFISKDCHPQIDFNNRGLIKIIFSKASRGMTLSFSGYAIESSIAKTIWPIFLIIILGTAEKVGYVAAISSFIAIAVIAMIGKYIDSAGTKKLLGIGTILCFCGWLATVFADTAFAVFIINSYRSISEKMMQLPWSSIFYKMINRETYFRMVVARDVIYNGSRLIFLPFVIVIFKVGYYPFVLSFLVAAIFTLLYPLVEKSAIHE